MTNDQFSFNDIPDLSGKVAIVTGSNTGIGKISARELARKNCHVIVASRNKEKGQAAVEDIIDDVGPEASVEFIQLDLMSLASVKAFVTEVKAKHERLDILLNNGGVMRPPFALTEDGIEQQFATNHVGPFYLTQSLLPLLEKSAPSRIVNVSALAHVVTSIFGINYDTINSPEAYDRTLQYGKTKVYVNANHPGIVRTELIRHSKPSGILSDIFVKPFIIDPDEGALTQLYLATSKDIETQNNTGQYYNPIAKIGNPNGYCKSDKNALELWNYTEKLLKEKISDYPGSTL